MGYSTELKKINSKRQTSSEITRERSVLPQSNRYPKHPDKLESKNSAGPHCSDLNHKARQDADGGIFVQSTGNWSRESDELVKYMSKLPGYLQYTDAGENIKEKALNVGVLDWARLEKWKNKQMRIPPIPSNFTSFNSTESSSRTATKSATSAAVRKKLADKKDLLSSSINASYKEGFPEGAKLSTKNVRRLRDSEIESKSTRDEQRMTAWTFKSFGKSYSDILLEKEKRKEFSKKNSRGGSFASNLRQHGVSLVTYEDTNGKADKIMDGLPEFGLKKKERDHKFNYGMKLPSSMLKNRGVSFGSKKRMGSGSHEKVEQPQELDTDISHKQCHSKPSNIVLLRPQEIPQSSSPEIFKLSQLRTSLDENFAESSRSRSSTVSLPEAVCPEDICSEIPQSCELHSIAEPAGTSATMEQSINTDKSPDHSCFVSETPAFSKKMSSLQSEDACIENDVLDIKLRNRSVFSDLKEPLDQETAELTAKRGRNLSPPRRFSFSLGKIGRSFSFKEGSTHPQFSSTYVSAKSGPVTSESSACLENSSKEKANGHNRTRSSPLRRLLDPILRHKASDIHHSAESSQTSKGILGSVSFRTNRVGESLHSEKKEGSSIQALLQLTMKNGLPLFKFVHNNERNILVAAKRSSASPEKHDLGCYFTFYLLNEIKKKSGGWISHGSKEKSCGYAYNVVGQMRFSSSKITEPSNQNCKRHGMVKEYVLTGAEISQTDQGPPNFFQGRELAALVLEIPCENLSHKGLHSDNNLLKKGCLKCLAEDRCLCSSGDDIYSKATVILPGGIHGLPNKGEPSPLIHRWKSGGSCDCGGWDIGCKLLVLSNQKHDSSIPKSSLPYLERFQLFVQERAEQNRPHFTLVPLKDGFYSVEFNSTISHLQAFFISVAVLSCQKLPCSPQMNDVQEFTQEIRWKNNNGLHGKAPVKYAPIPPLSPFGRV